VIPRPLDDVLQPAKQVLQVLIQGVSISLARTISTWVIHRSCRRGAHVEVLVAPMLLPDGLFLDDLNL
jgi:hypothetical protein